MENKKKDETMEQTEEIVEETAEEEKDQSQKEADKDEKTSVDPKDKKIEELTDRYQRLMAEFENARKRMTKESVQKYEDRKSVV